MFAALLLKVKGWLAAIGAIVLAVGAAFLYGRFKQKQSDKTNEEKQQEQQVQEVNKINQQNADVRQGVEDMIHALPPATPVVTPAQPQQAPTPEVAVKIADANPDSSTGRLRDWSRDSSSN